MTPDNNGPQTYNHQIIEYEKTNKNSLKNFQKHMCFIMTFLHLRTENCCSAIGNIRIA